MKLTRRQFLEYTALTCSEMALLPGILEAAPSERSAVAEGIYSKATDSSGTINPETARTLFEETLKTFCQTSSVQDAWMKVFAGLQEKDRIGIKINTINRHVPTHPELVQCVTDSLVRFGVDPRNITIYDRLDRELKKAGYTINKGNKGIQCYGTSHEGAGFDSEYKIKIGDKEFRASSILSRDITYLINMPVLKDHKSSGTTFSLKNHYGSIPLIDTLPNPKAALSAFHMHSDNCETQIVELNSDPLIRGKTRLIIGDAVIGMYEGGPMGAPQFSPNRIFISRDPVATDYLATQIIEEKRKEMGLSGVWERARYIRRAAKAGLGRDQLDQLEILKVQLG